MPDDALLDPPPIPAACLVLALKEKRGRREGCCGRGGGSIVGAKTRTNVGGGGILELV